MPIPLNPMNPSDKGAFGYMQNPVMNGAGLPQKLPVQANGAAYARVPMYQPKSVK